ncbi:DUF3291 domain-containing protein [Photobacterium sp. WH24]|uniref:DUF3291 domain-containing protein n=1 Tax=Photobacterium arenosum TaxID=2774143 RepID=A0ABR9BFP2_9GAMM|nr:MULTISPECIES: DUF3291 domain-containing protein [Photobacterium]MBD8511382.1 DUF3291 domain-containing protein [Photobacterium arenosum]MBV7263040.1 DUF3291 domain-containing protein [Photobacterium sp. WH24]
MKLAQLNIALAKYPMDAPEIKDFADNLDPVNAIAESSEGFIWRLQDESGDATSIQAFDAPNMLINMSVWESVDTLKNFMFRTHHRDFMRRKAEWFHRSAEDTYVLWWVEDDHIPTIAEAKERLDYLRNKGDSPFAFTFKSNFTPDDALAYELEA